jgi:hypothetical protein
MVVAHNSPFVRTHNAASNQVYPVLDQLNDGVRGCTFLPVYKLRNPRLTMCPSAVRNPETQCIICDSLVSHFL